MSLFGGIMDTLFGVGGSPEIPEPDWDALEKLMKEGVKANRFDQYGPFTSQVWDADKQGVTTQVNPQIQGGFDALLSRVNEGTPGYGRAGQYGSLLDAMNFGQYPERSPMPPMRERQVIERAQGRPDEYRKYKGGMGDYFYREGS